MKISVPATITSSLHELSPIAWELKSIARYFWKRLLEKAAAYERASIMRDLHDGLLQNLTAARAQLELLTSDDEHEKARIETIRGLLRTEQLRLRQFIDEAGAADTEMVELALFVFLDG